MTRAWTAVVLLVLAGCGAGTEPVDCSSTQGWSDDAVSLLTVEEAPLTSLRPKGYGVSARLGVPAVWTAQRVPVPAVVISSGSLRFPVSVESVASDGGFAPFQFHVLLDGEPWPATLVQDGGTVVRPLAAPNGIADFEVNIPAPVEAGAHDLVAITAREKPVGVLGLAQAWVFNSTAIVPPGAAVSGRAVARTGNGSQVVTSDGGIVALPNSHVPAGGRFSWVAHLEEDSEEARTTCVGTVRRYRLIATLDCALLPFAGGEFHLDVEAPVGGAIEVPFELDGLPTSAGHSVVILLQLNPGYFQARPDGTTTPWFFPLVGEVGSTWW